MVLFSHFSVYANAFSKSCTRSKQCFEHRSLTGISELQ
ncbi:hypothetical protein ABEKA_1405 [Acinetobacter lwoffii]|nr:hypothetical protein ABEKA_1405 [Acinetobacter lwoffii]